MSGAMLLLLSVFFLWNCVLVIGLIMRYEFSFVERVCLFVHMALCAAGAALFGAGTVYEIIHIVWG